MTRAERIEQAIEHVLQGADDETRRARAVYLRTILAESPPSPEQERRSPVALARALADRWDEKAEAVASSDPGDGDVFRFRECAKELRLALDQSGWAVLTLDVGRPAPAPSGEPGEVAALRAEIERLYEALRREPAAVPCPTCMAPASYCGDCNDKRWLPREQAEQIAALNRAPGRMPSGEPAPRPVCPACGSENTYDDLVRSCSTCATDTVLATVRTLAPAEPSGEPESPTRTLGRLLDAAGFKLEIHADEIAAPGAAPSGEARCRCGHPMADHYGRTLTCAVPLCECLFGRASEGAK